MSEIQCHLVAKIHLHGMVEATYSVSVLGSAVAAWSQGSRSSTASGSPDVKTL